MQGKVEICGVNTAELRVLKGEETRALLEKAQSGDAAARDELIRGNLRLVLSVIQKFAGRGENVDDLFQVGCIGLIKAIDHFDLKNHDVKFSTYGVPMTLLGGENMTRAKAIRIITHYLDTTDGLDDELRQAKYILENMLSDYRGKKWDAAASHAAVDSFLAAHGRPPTVRELDSLPGLPCHRSIELEFGMKAAEWLRENYPHEGQKYRFESHTPEEYKNLFIREYDRIRPRSGLDYNRRRDPRCPTWQYTAQVLGLRLWSELIALCRDELPKRSEYSFQVESRIVDIQI